MSLLLASSACRYGLPLFTVLPNREMLLSSMCCRPPDGSMTSNSKPRICTYQPVTVEGGEHEDEPTWKKGPAWHKEFNRELPNDPLLHTDVYEVKATTFSDGFVLNCAVTFLLSGR